MRVVYVQKGLEGFGGHWALCFDDDANEKWELELIGKLLERSVVQLQGLPVRDSDLKLLETMAEQVSIEKLEEAKTNPRT